MLDISTFLIRWLFLCNLIRDVAEIQMLPYTPYAPPPQPDDHSSYYQQPTDHGINQQQTMTPCQEMGTPEEIWKDQCVRGILSYPPGSQRLLVIDAMRVDLVQQLSRTMRILDDTHQNLKQKLRKIARIENGATDATDHGGTNNNDILSFQPTNDINDLSSRATLRAQLKQAKHKIREVRSFMPQITSAVLKSPPAFDPNLVNPVQKLRSMILTRCQQDPCWGIELCWVLEAEVGHAWKNLFEHRQQTGKRLIVVLPAEKAAVLAKIGTEKREAFDLLQDAEQLTAFGYLPDLVVDGRNPTSQTSDQTSAFQAKRLPSSLSLRRCSHFGDTMHFIDRLTRISMDLIRVPTPQRLAFLVDSLHDVNRRLRRRMATAGEVSLDVNDKLGPYDWPGIRDVNQNMIQHSIHFPLESYSGVWNQGCRASFKDSRDGVMAVLNVVVDESKILSSRERCPYLIHLEVVRTGVDGSDPILYSCGAETLGITVREALGMSSETLGSSPIQPNSNSPKYEIPPELQDVWDPTAATESGSSHKVENSLQHRLPRGGWQVETYEPDASQGDVHQHHAQHDYQEVHSQLQVAPPQPYAVTNQGPMVSFGAELLEKVFGRPFSEKSEEIRRNSPYGNLDGWRLASFIVKAGEDIRREAMVAQIISKLDKWFKAEIQEIDRPHMRPYTIMCVGGDSGLVECLSDAKSIDEVKKNCDGFTSLRDYFERAYCAGGLQPNQDPSSRTRQITFEEAQNNFLRSLVGYSLVCYILQVKDRHNANILLDREGNIVHIDFGYVLGDTPKMAKVPIFSERAPFKLSTEFWDVLGGWNVHSRGLGVRFCKMFERAFECASSHSDEIASVVEATMLSLTRNPEAAALAASGVRSRLHMRGTPDSVDQKMFIMDMVNTALTSWGTTTYDWLQKSMNGYQ